MLRRLLAVLALSSSTVPTVAASPEPTLTVVHEDTSAIMGRGLALTLSELPALEAAHVATGWALSPERNRRAAIAQALEWTFPLGPDALIIEHLSRDVDPRIRASVARAAWVRRETRVLLRLADDPDPEVRAIAARAGLR